MLSLPRLSTKRLKLRPLATADAVSLQKIASDRAIADTTISIPHPYPDGEAKRYILKHICVQSGKIINHK
ncbi:MAG: GNAT family N-acetyltransferase [Cyanobacteria bacterium P01_G01_bin.39]